MQLYIPYLLIPLSLALSVSCKSTQEIEEFATVVANGPYAIHETEEKYPFLVISYEKCPHIRESFRLVAIGDGGYAELEPTKEQKECIGSIKKGERVSVTIDSTTNHISTSC